jgi:Na+-driven multidrug efflux pump
MLFTRKKEVLEIANRALHIYTYSVVGFGLTMTIQGAFIGLGKTKVPLVLGILRIWLLRYLFILATERYLQYYAVFWGNLFSNYMAALLAILLISRVRWESAIDPNPKPEVAAAGA